MVVPIQSKAAHTFHWPKNGSYRLADHAQHVEKLFKSIAPSFALINFTFSRIKKSQIQFVTLDMDIVKMLETPTMLFDGCMLDRNSINPIYDRFGYNSERRETTAKLLGVAGSNIHSIALEYDIGVAKDVFTFLFLSNEEFDLRQLYFFFHEVCLYFYANVEEESLDVIWKIEGSQISGVKLFSPFEEYGKRNDLTRIQSEYLKIFSTGMSVNTISNTLNRSLRTVESAISSIKNQLGIDSRNNLNHHLKLYYCNSVYRYLFQRKGFDCHRLDQ